MTNSLLITPNYGAEEALGSRIAMRLSDATDGLPSDISERLKAARMQALAKRKIVKIQIASGVSSTGSAAVLHMGGGDQGFWNRIASLIPLFLLIAGLLAIAMIQDQKRTHEIAEVDIELLADELPPAAYTDPGFLRYMNVNRRD